MKMAALRKDSACPKRCLVMRIASIHPGDEPPGTRAVGVILGAELRAEESLFRAYPRDERWNKQRREHNADAGAKREGPPERIHEQAQITGIAYDTVDAIGNKRMPGLDRH